MATFTESTLSKNTELPQPWKELVKHPTALNFIISTNSICFQGNQAAHTSSKEMIADSVLSLQGQERDLMKLILQPIQKVD